VGRIPIYGNIIGSLLKPGADSSEYPDFQARYSIWLVEERVALLSSLSCPIPTKKKHVESRRI
jgi:hypothetical protein